MCEDKDFMKEKILNFAYYADEYSKIKTEKRKLEFLNARLTLNNLCKKAIYVHYDENGKPFCIDNNAHISISHSKNYIAVAIHPEKATGVDIETISERALRVCNKFLSDDEQKEIGGENPKLNFLLAWSAKEALYKIIGKQAVDFRSQLRVFPFEPHTEGIMKVLHIPADKFYYAGFKIFTDFVVVYCNE